MIWARCFSTTVESRNPLWARLQLAPDGLALLRHSHEQHALVTGLDDDQRELLAELVGASWVGGSGDAALVRVSPGACEAWAARLGASPLGVALHRLLDAEVSPRPTTIGPRTFTWGTRTHLMGVLNLTPDSFSDGGQLGTVEAAVARGAALVEQGAEILDVGGESTRPGAAPVSEDEELRRVVPVIAALKAKLPEVVLSVDTSKAKVAREALAAGAHLVNDVTGLRDDAMLEVLASTGAHACVMHMQGTPRTMQESPKYDDVVAEVLDGLESALVRAASAGVPRSRLLVDPGLGFGKTAAHNWFLLRRLSDLRLLGAPVVLGASRKSFLAEPSGGKPAAERDGASAAVAALVAGAGAADVLRVHDVAAAKTAIAVGDALRAGGDGGARFGS